MPAKPRKIPMRMCDKMPAFGTDDVKTRRDSLQQFLDEMGW